MEIVRINTYRVFFLLIFFGPMNFLRAQCADTTAIYKFQIAGKNYELVKEKKTWTQAAACAVERGGYLTQIGNASEQTAIYNAIVAAGVSSSYNPITDGGGTSYVWIGATDRKAEGNWVWDGSNSGTGTAFWIGQGAAGSGGGTAQSGAYVNWGGSSVSSIKEPDDFGGAQDGAAMALAGWPSGTSMLGIAGEWNDVAETNTQYYVIEFGATSGFNSEKKQLKIELFPNPAFTETELVLSQPVTGGSYRLLDAFGQQLTGQIFPPTDRIQISLEHYCPGIYFLEITGMEGRWMERLVRN